MSKDETDIWTVTYKGLLAKIDTMPGVNQIGGDPAHYINRCADAADEAVRRYRSRTGQEKK